MDPNEILRQWLALLNDTAVKTGLLFAGGILLRVWPAYVNKAIPFALGVGSAVVSTLALMFPTIVPSAHPGAFAFGSFCGLDLYAAASPFSKSASWVWNTLAPLAFSAAGYDIPKTTAEWIRLGVGLIWPAGRPPAK